MKKLEIAGIAMLTIGFIGTLIVALWRPINNDSAPEIRVVGVDGCSYIYVVGHYVVHSASCTNKIHHTSQ